MASRNGATPSLTWTDIPENTTLSVVGPSQWSHAISDLQARLLAGYILGDVPNYVPFMVR